MKWFILACENSDKTISKSCDREKGNIQDQLTTAQLARKLKVGFRV